MITMQSIIIVDDMNEHIQYIKNIIQDMSYSFRIQTFHNIQAFQSQIQQFDDDAIIIMDILLGQNDGIELAKQLNQLQRHFQIIFVSSYLEKATLVYDTKHCYFVYKPEARQRLPMAILKAMQNTQNEKRVLAIDLKDGTTCILLKDILYIERIQRYSYIHTPYEVIKTSLKIKDLLQQLTLPFIRTHNSYIINAQYVKELKRIHVILQNQQSIPISRAYQEHLKQQFHLFLMQQL